MATGEKFTREVQKVVQITEEGIVLRLSYAEAETLLAVTNKIGGNPQRSQRRRHVDAIRDALISSRLFKEEFPPVVVDEHGSANTIMFSDDFE